MSWTDKDKDDLEEVVIEAVKYNFMTEDEPEEVVLEKSVQDLVEAYADNAFTDLHEHADDEIREMFETHDGHAHTMEVVDKWFGTTFTADFKNMHPNLFT